MLDIGESQAEPDARVLAWRLGIPSHKEAIKLVAATDMSVLILGENGTGKEHIAHHLHEKSKRSGKPFVAVDCGSLSA